MRPLTKWEAITYLGASLRCLYWVRPLRMGGGEWRLSLIEEVKKAKLLLNPFV